MIELRPFRAWRAAPDKAHLVGSRSYVSYTPEQLSEKLAGNPYTFLHVVHPDTQGSAPEPADRRERFRRTRHAFKAFCDEGILVRDAEPCIYVYEQTGRGNTTRGIITGVSVEAYRDGRIKVHEQTLTAREQLFVDYLQHTGVNAEPVLLATPDGTAWEALLDPITNRRPDHDFSTTDRVRHRLWACTDVKLREDLQRRFADIPALYIADGHHRMASSAGLADREQATDVDPKAWCLAYIVPRQQLYIYNFDRVVRGLNGHSVGSFHEALAQVGELRPVAAPWAGPGSVAVYLAGQWYTLALPPAEGAAADRLDAARLNTAVLAPVLGIHDLRTDPRVHFVPGTSGTHELQRQVDNGEADVAFHLHPVQFTELQAVADSGGIMPPKSTYIEPKLRSGFTVYSLEDV